VSDAERVDVAVGEIGDAALMLPDAEGSCVEIDAQRYRSSWRRARR
jgi:hypothetical protein